MMNGLQWRCHILPFWKPKQKNSGKQRKNSGRFAVFWAAARATAQGFCGERDVARCKFPGKTAKTAKLEQCAVTDDLERRAAVRAAFARDFAAGGPGPAFEDTGEREFLRALAEALAHRRRQA